MRRRDVLTLAGAVAVAAMRPAITGTRWNGPKFFGLREKPEKAAAP
jgi:hypothetical protein